MNNFDYKNMTPFKWFVLENFPFIENDFEAIDNYRLFSKVVEYLNKTIDNMNLTGEQMENVTNAMTELQNYVNNYFDNLDVQEEINNKLDELVANGTLYNIMKPYFTSVDTKLEQIENKVNSAVSGSPLVASSVSEMTDTTRVYVNTTDGHWYYYNGSAWTNGGVYQATEDSETVNLLNDNIGVLNNSVFDNNILSYQRDDKGGISTSTGAFTQSSSGHCYQYKIKANTNYKIAFNNVPDFWNSNNPDYATILVNENDVFTATISSSSFVVLRSQMLENNKLVYFIKPNIDSFLLISVRGNITVIVNEFTDIVQNNSINISKNTNDIQNLKTGIIEPLGKLDNYLPDAWIGGAIRYNIDSSNYINQIFPFIRVLKNNEINRYGLEFSSSSISTLYFGLILLRIKKNGNSNREIVISSVAGGVTYIKENDEEGSIIYQGRNPSNIARGIVLENSENYITICLNKTSERTIISYSNSTRDTYENLDLDMNRSAVFLPDVALDDIDWTKRYYSRSEKLGSKLRGKTCLVFSDSLANFVNYLASDWGMCVYSMNAGGCRMGYETGSGAGGETGTANSLWLCNNDRINKIKNLNIDNLDYIINACGTNGSVTETDAEEVKFVLNNKHWYNDEREDIFDTLSDNDKKRFTATACELASFITLNQIYKNAISVITSLYTTSGSSYSQYFTEQKWDNLEKCVEAIFSSSNLYPSKNSILENLAKQSGIKFINAGQAGVNIINTPYYATDGTHPNNSILENYSANIARKL